MNTKLQQRPKNHFQDVFFPRSFNHLLDNFFGNEFQDTPATNHFFRPGAEVGETDNAFSIRLSLPGMEKDQIQIEIKGDELLISGERKESRKEDNEKIHLSEITYGRFSRSFRLPETVNRDEISAEFKDGLLHINLPKTEERKPKSISIK